MLFKEVEARGQCHDGVFCRGLAKAFGKLGRCHEGVVPREEDLGVKGKVLGDDLLVVE